MAKFHAFHRMFELLAVLNAAADAGRPDLKSDVLDTARYMVREGQAPEIALVTAMRICGVLSLCGV